MARPIRLREFSGTSPGIFRRFARPVPSHADTWSRRTRRPDPRPAQTMPHGGTSWSAADPICMLSLHVRLADARAPLHYWNSLATAIGSSRSWRLQAQAHEKPKNSAPSKPEDKPYPSRGDPCSRPDCRMPRRPSVHIFIWKDARPSRSLSIRASIPHGDQLSGRLSHVVSISFPLAAIIASAMSDKKST